MIRRLIQPRLTRVAQAFPVIAITWPRQSGKSTLCRETFPNKPIVVLESPGERRRAEQDPAGFLARFPEAAIFEVEIRHAGETG
jgi:predicted AAA+ superfamily ATPase